jgi:hypothetical protein
MSTRWPGGIINGTAPVPTGGGAGDSASGVWTLDQADQYIAVQNWPGTGIPDPQFQYVTALLHGDGTNGGQNNTFLDSSSNNFAITRNGNTTQGSFSPYGNLWSTFGSYFTVPDNSAFDFGAGDFTIEGWVNPPDSAQTNIVCRNFSASTGFILSTTNFLAAISTAWDISITFSSGFPGGQWSHFAVVRNGNVFTCYINGTSVGTQTISGTIANSSGDVQIGRRNGQTNFVGYLSNLRIVKGTAVYTTTFTPPTVPLTAITNTSLLASQSNRFRDASANNFTITPVGSPSVQRFSPFQSLATYQTAKIGGSMTANGNSANYLSLASNSAFDQDTSFTIECWAYPTFTSGSGFLWYMNVSGYYSIFMGSAGRFNVSKTAVGEVYTSAVFPQNCWYHLALSFDGTNTRFYINGILVFTGTGLGPTSGAAFTIGDAIGVAPWNGYISDLRFVKSALYTGSTLTVPTAPLRPVANTSLLTNFTNGAIFDSDASNNFETVGNAQISTSVVKYGTGSMFFDGTGDWLSAPATPQSNLGSGNFTIECWLYRTASGAASDSGIVSRGAPSNTNGFVFGYNSSNLLTFNFNYSGVIVAGTTAIPINTWTHVAVTRTGNTFRLFLNGNIDATATSSNSQNTNAADVLYVGRSGFSSDRIVTGYIDDVRITLGYARYWYNFQPPTRAFPNYGGTEILPAEDPLFENVTLLLNGNGTNGAQNNTFLDSSTNNFTITRNGNTTQGSFSPYGNLWSNYFNRAASNYLTAPANTNWELGASSTYSGECYVYLNTLSSQTVFMGSLNKWWLGQNFTDIGGTSGRFVIGIFNGSSWQNVNSTFVPVVGTWYHLAFTFSSGTLKLYVNGVEQGTSTGISVNSFSSALNIAVVLNPGYFYGLDGYISNMRIIKGGTLVYTSNFTPSTTPLTATANTVFLSCQSNRFVDNSTNNYTITAVNSPSVQRFSPFEPTAPYSTSVIGGSAYMDGTGDYLRTASNVSLGSTYTFEAWVYFNSVLSGANAENSLFGSGAANGVDFGYGGSTGTRWFMAIFGAGFTIESANTTIQLNTWYHVAWVKNGTTGTIYVNGVQVATGTYNPSSVPTTALSIGSYGTVGTITGYISDARYVDGTALYTTTFTPPTAPLTAISGTALLANMTNAGIPDLAMQNNLETVGNAQVSTAQSKFGGSSLAFDGTGDYLTSRSTAIGTSGYTVEYWIYPTSSATLQGIFVTSLSAVTGNLRTGIYLGKLYVDIYDGTGSINAGSSIALNTWTHVAITKEGSTYRSFLNGNLNTTWTDSTNITGTDWTIGRLQSDGYDYTGYIQDLRITRGIARYVQPFTPPTQAFQTY